jgi:hypothetical protein
LRLLLQLLLLKVQLLLLLYLLLPLTVLVSNCYRMLLLLLQPPVHTRIIQHS